jgi:hypothetical protein
MEIKNPPDPRWQNLISIVAEAVERRMAMGQPDYWDYATLLELRVLAKNETGAARTLTGALAAVRENWEPKTTARNLRLIREARQDRNEFIDWAKKIEEALLKRANK